MRWCLPERPNRTPLFLLLVVVCITYFLSSSRQQQWHDPLSFVDNNNNTLDQHHKALSLPGGRDGVPSQTANNSSLAPLGNPNTDQVDFRSHEDAKIKTNNVKVSSEDGIDFVVYKNRVFKKGRPKKGVNRNNDNEIPIWPPHLDLTMGSELYDLDLSKFTPEEREFLEARREVMVERARSIKRACAAGDRFLSTNIPNPHFVFDQTHTPHIAWCPNYKVASTSWMVNFMKLAHFNEDNPAIKDLPKEKKERLQFLPKYGARHPVVFKLFPTPPTDKEKVRVLKRSVRMIIVRHPFTRLLSAYRDKMIKPRPLPSKFKFKELQREIIASYRPRDSDITSPFPTFSEFVQYVINFTAPFKTAQQWREEVVCWTPYWVQCGVCNTDYNVIIKLETMTEDNRFIITLSSLTELQKSADEWRHLRNVSSSQAAPEFYSQLTTQQMLDLHLRYKPDFDLFDYTIDEFLPLARDAKR